GITSFEPTLCPKTDNANPRTIGHSVPRSGANASQSAWPNGAIKFMTPQLDYAFGSAAIRIRRVGEWPNRRSLFSPFRRFTDSLCPLRRLRVLHVFGVFAEARFAVAEGAMMECLLRGSDVRCTAFPRFQHGSLQSASVGEAQLPRQPFHAIHCVEMFGGLLIGLTAGEKDETRHGGRNDVLHAAHGRLRD